MIITFSIDNGSDARTIKITDTALDRIVAWGLATFSMPNDDDGKPVSERTADWALNRWIDIILADAMYGVQQYEKDKAMAAVSVPKFDFQIK